ncbi:hypothetical protein B0H14DRAFT_2592223 [Mycena olivaceomarginata]|nr:hypothetical protein B0H14DRAFT_2592223 [Mycena olivaceomarginata]
MSFLDWNFDNDGTANNGGNFFNMTGNGCNFAVMPDNTVFLPNAHACCGDSFMKLIPDAASVILLKNLLSQQHMGPLVITNVVLIPFSSDSLTHRLKLGPNFTNIVLVIFWVPATPGKLSNSLTLTEDLRPDEKNNKYCLCRKFRGYTDGFGNPRVHRGPAGNPYGFYTRPVHGYGFCGSGYG